MRIATYNVNSIRTRLPIVLDWIGNHRPDLLCLQETKTPDAAFPVEPIQAAGYHAVFRGQKGGNGVAILSRTPVDILGAGLDDGDPPDEARLLAVRAGCVTLVNTYVPQGRELTHPMFAYKLAWFQRLRRWFERHADPRQPVLWVGDLNVAPDAIDVHHPERHGRHVCFHPDVRAALASVMAWGFTDVFRRHHPGETGGYSFYDYRSRDAIERGLGWRVDHILATPPLAERCRDCWIDLQPRRAAQPSDHTVVVADFDGDQRA